MDKLKSQSLLFAKKANLCFSERANEQPEEELREEREIIIMQVAAHHHHE